MTGLNDASGIGVLLIPNIDLLNYRSASVLVITITSVVTAMDFLRTELRERTVYIGASIIEVKRKD